MEYQLDIGAVTRNLGPLIDGLWVTLQLTLQSALVAIVGVADLMYHLVAPLGIRLPVYPVKGYSLTIPISDASRAPESTVMDETYKIAITRLDNRIRSAGWPRFQATTRPLSRRAAARWPIR